MGRQLPMYCPKCGAEYRAGFTRCHDCEVLLVDAPPAKPDPPVRAAEPSEAPVELVVIFQTADPLLLALAKASLESQDIPFVTQGEGAQDLIGLGRVPGGFNLATGPVRIHVRADDAQRARDALADIEPR